MKRIIVIEIAIEHNESEELAKKAKESGEAVAKLEARGYPLTAARAKAMKQLHREYLAAERDIAHAAETIRDELAGKMAETIAHTNCRIVDVQKHTNDGCWGDEFVWGEDEDDAEPLQNEG